MKLSPPRLARTPVLCVRAFALAALLVAPTSTPAQGREVQPQSTPRPSPAPPVTPPARRTAQAQEVTPAGAQAQQTVPRERRAQAYTKLLEGQRYLSAARGSGGITRDNLAAAQQAFRQAAELNPALAEAHTALAEIAFFFLEDMEQAEREAQAAARINPNNFGAHRILSRIYSLKAGLEDGEVERAAADRAIGELREVLRLDPNDAEALALVGEFYLATGRNDEAVEAFRRWSGAPATMDTRFYQVVTQGRELSPDTAAARLAQALLRAGRAPEAVEAVRRAIALNPDNQNYIALLGEAVRVSGGSEAAVTADLQRLAQTYPTNVAIASLLARTQARAGKVNEAAATLRAGISRQENFTREQNQLREELAQVYAEAMRYEDALAVYEEALKARGVGDEPLNADSDKQFAAPYLERIVNLQRQFERTPEAHATVERMRRLLGAGDPIADYYRVVLLREEGKRREALEAVRAARLKFAEQPVFLRLEASTLAELGRVEEAAELLRGRLTGKAAQDYQAYLELANLYLEAGRGKEAVEAARKALELAPAGNSQAVNAALVMLSSAQERAGDPKGAEEALRRILAKEPNNATALNNLGYFLTERNEQLQEALDTIKHAVTAEPAHASFLDSLG